MPCGSCHRPVDQSVQAEQQRAQSIIHADHGNDPLGRWLGAGGGPREVVKLRFDVVGDEEISTGRAPAEARALAIPE